MSADAARLKLLYIEDNDSNLQLVERIFRDRHDVALRTAARGQEGLDLARAEQPDLILLDLHLPDMPGTQVLNALRGDARTAAIPVVAVSADATHDQVANLHAKGVVDYVTKPFEVARLLGVVDSYIKPDDELLDPARVAELIELEPDGSTFRALAASALAEAASEVAVIAAGGDPAAVSAAAHSLKSSAALVGARRLASLADAMERAARRGSLPDLSAVGELKRTLTDTEQATHDVGGRGQ